MFSYCCNAKPDIENVLEKDMDNLRTRIEEMKKQIKHIYELLEVLTNESKRNDLNINNINNVSKENDNKTKHTYFIDKTTV